VLVASSTVGLAVMAHQAVSSYRDNATNQLNNVISGEMIGLPVELRGVPFGEILNSNYKHIKTLDGDYKDLLTDTKSYVAVLDAYTALLEQYNAGIKGKKPLSSDLLKSVNKYKAVMENRFPNEKDMAKVIGELAIKITSSSDFDDISDSVEVVLQSGERFLTKLREELNARIARFQEEVN
jgi:hypothetical protein